MRLRTRIGLSKTNRGPRHVSADVQAYDTEQIATPTPTATAMLVPDEMHLPTHDSLLGKRALNPSPLDNQPAGHLQRIVTMIMTMASILGTCKLRAGSILQGAKNCGARARFRTSAFTAQLFTSLKEGKGCLVAQALDFSSLFQTSKPPRPEAWNPDGLSLQAQLFAQALGQEGGQDHRNSEPPGYSRDEGSPNEVCGNICAHHDGMRFRSLATNFFHAVCAGMSLVGRGPAQNYKTRIANDKVTRCSHVVTDLHRRSVLRLRPVATQVRLPRDESPQYLFMPLTQTKQIDLKHAAAAVPGGRLSKRSAMKKQFKEPAVLSGDEHVQPSSIPRLFKVYDVTVVSTQHQASPTHPFHLSRPRSCSSLGGRDT